ncbi:hypothetical protein O3G_MSEX011269 [Manduca sexta]|uniref:Reverse transcriptase domain-containing protein n=1 Tax=Manduca sexta TaxID=7130 RepID=A0A921ZJZ4_MANSE|nr:hypothetical protein O3G_MSEX011269 [Manduca sexta]
MESDDVQQQYDNIENCIKNACKMIKQTPLMKRKLSRETKILLEERLKLNNNKNTEEFKIKDRKVKRNIRKDLRHYNNTLVQAAIDNKKSLKIVKNGISKSKSWITCLKDQNGTKYQNKARIMDICTDFYKSLYSDPQNHLTTNLYKNNVYSCPETISPITAIEVHTVLKSMKYNRVPGEDGICTEIMKIAEYNLRPHIFNLFNLILKSGNFPANFCHSNIILLHKKGEKSNINNYRPISLVAHLYKAFVKIIHNRIEEQLDLEQPPEQAGFRKGLSTTDHLHTINQLIEKNTMNTIFPFTWPLSIILKHLTAFHIPQYLLHFKIKI